LCGPESKIKKKTGQEQCRLEKQQKDFGPKSTFVMILGKFRFRSLGCLEHSESIFNEALWNTLKSDNGWEENNGNIEWLTTLRKTFYSNNAMETHGDVRAFENRFLVELYIQWEVWGKLCQNLFVSVLVCRARLQNRKVRFLFNSSAVNGRSLFETMSTTGYKNCREVRLIGRMAFKLKS
jgi:hypothetical protein